MDTAASLRLIQAHLFLEQFSPDGTLRLGGLTSAQAAFLAVAAPGIRAVLRTLGFDSAL